MSRRQTPRRRPQALCPAAPTAIAAAGPPVDGLRQSLSLGLVPGTEPARRFAAALRNGQPDEARRIAVDEAPSYELSHFLVEPLLAKLETLPRHFMAGREASRKLAHMLLKELVDQMYGGDVSTGGHRGSDGRWYVFRGLSPDPVEVSSSVIENVDKARFLEWAAPLEALLVRHLSGRMDREAFVAATRHPDLLDAATYPHRLQQEAATGGSAGEQWRAGLRPPPTAPWDPQKDPDLRVCFSGEHGYIVIGSGKSHLIDQVYHESERIVRQMSQRELLTVARRVPAEMLQPDYPNLIRNVMARVTPILGLPPGNRLEIREDMEEGGRDNILLMLALSRARHAGWLSDAVVEEIYALRGKDPDANGTVVTQGVDSYRELVARLVERPDDRRFLDDLDPAEARIILNDATQLLQHQRARSTFATPAGRLRRGLALLKVLSLHGVLDGFMIHPYADCYLYPAQFGRMAALYEGALRPRAKTDRQSFLEELAREPEVCRRAGLNPSRIEANLVTQRVPGLVAHAGAMAERALGAALQAVPDRPVTLLFHLRDWVRSDPASPVWALDLDQAHARLLAPWAAVLRPGDYLVLFDSDAEFAGRMLAGGEFEHVDLYVGPPDAPRPAEATRPEPARTARRLFSAFDMPNYAVVLRKTAAGQD